MDTAGVGRFAHLVVDASSIVGTSYEDGPFSVFVLDREDAAPRQVLPIEDFDGYYSNGGLSVPGVLPDGTVLLSVMVPGAGRGSRLVAWQPETGHLSLVARIDVDRYHWISSFAWDLLG